MYWVCRQRMERRKCYERCFELLCFEDFCNLSEAMMRVWKVDEVDHQDDWWSLLATVTHKVDSHVTTACLLSRKYNHSTRVQPGPGTIPLD